MSWNGPVVVYTTICVCINSKSVRRNISVAVVRVYAVGVYACTRVYGLLEYVLFGGGLDPVVVRMCTLVLP